MPYIDSAPRDSALKFEEDNLQEIFGQLLLDNGWTLARTFYKATVDTRAYFQVSNRVNYAIAKHTIFRNADGQLLGFAVVGQFNLKMANKSKIPIRRPYDTTDETDVNFGILPDWDTWVKQRFADTQTKSNLYFYMMEKLPNTSLVPDNGVLSIVTQPGMGGTEYRFDRDWDRDNWHSWWYGTGNVDYDNDSTDMEFDGKMMTASPFHVIRAALDVEVLATEWDDATKSVFITETDHRVMQSPIVKTTLRAEFLEHVDTPVWHTNWWTDSEIRVKGHVDSTNIFLILQADNAPAWENNVVPTIPLYFGKVISVDGETDEGYALFSGTIPPTKQANSQVNLTTRSKDRIYPETTIIVVDDGTRLPDAPALITLGGKEIVKLVSKDGNLITVEREQQGTLAATPYYGAGTVIARLSTNNTNISNETVVSMFDFDDPNATVGEIIQPLLKQYPRHPSNGVDSVMVSRGRFGARYQAHYLSWNAPPNQLPPTRMSEEGKKYPRAYEPIENTNNYKYQFNASRYSGKIHSSRIFLVHPEEGVRGYLDKSIAFNPQSLRETTLRVRRQDCPTPLFDMYKYSSIGAVSPLTKKPATVFRSAGVGVYSHDFDPNAEPLDHENDVTPPSDVTITEVASIKVQSVDIRWELPSDADLKHVNIYVDEVLYAKGITGTTYYRINDLTTGFKPTIKIKSVDVAGNESTGVTAETVTVV